MTIFVSILTTFEAIVIIEAAGAVVKISLCLQITNFNQVKLVQISDTNCMSNCIAYFNVRVY